MVMVGGLLTTKDFGFTVDGCLVNYIKITKSRLAVSLYFR